MDVHLGDDGGGTAFLTGSGQFLADDNWQKSVKN